MKLYRNALDLQGDVVRMADLGNMQGVQYLYSILYKFGLIYSSKISTYYFFCRQNLGARHFGQVVQGDRHLGQVVQNLC